jgi:bifunctional non-homologous end joining protein LigD
LKLLEEYKRKRQFNQTPEPAGTLEKKPGFRFVVQKHRASHLHFDFRLEMEGVLKSWAVPKGPSLDPAEKRLAMMTEDHPVSYFHFEGTIPEGNYGAGTVMVWDTGRWEPYLEEPLPKGRAGDREKIALEMLKKGDLKFILHGSKLNGAFVLARMRSRRPGSRGNEWLLIKKHDEHEKAGFDANDAKYDRSVLTKRSLAAIGGDEESAQWKSSRPAASRSKAAALETHEERLKRQGKSLPASSASPNKTRASAKVAAAARPALAKKQAAQKKKTQNPVTQSPEKQSLPASRARTTNQASPADSAGELKSLKGAERTAMPRNIQPMLATLVDEPFDDNDWLFEIKWDGYRGVAYNDKGKVQLFSRNQNELTGDFPEVADELGARLRARQAIVDGEVVALDDSGRPSFSLMQQRSGLSLEGKRRVADRNIPIVYYAFDLLYLDGYSLMRVDLEERKRLLARVLPANDRIRISEHFVGKGKALFEAAQVQKVEGIIAKRRKGCYIQKRTREWLKIKLTQRQECVIGGYTDPRGSREHFGSLILGLYDKQGRLIPVGQAGSGFTQASHAAMWKKLQALKTEKNPFHGKPDSPRTSHWVKPEMVAEIRFTEWTHETGEGGIKMRAPVFQGLRADKKPRECVFETKRSSRKEATRAERGDVT